MLLEVPQHPTLAQAGPSSRITRLGSIRYVSSIFIRASQVTFLSIVSHVLILSLPACLSSCLSVSVRVTGDGEGRSGLEGVRRAHR